MSRKHFQQLADALRQNKPTAMSGEAEIELFRQLVRDIGTACGRANPRFNRSRFERASGVEELPQKAPTARQEALCAS
jgi:hypothetical protein